MTRNYRVLSATNVLAMSIVLLLSIVVYPLAFMVYASTGPLEDELTNNNLNSNDTGSAADPLSGAVLTLGDGTSALNPDSATGSLTDTAGSSGAVATVSDSSTNSPSSDSISPDSSTSDSSADSSSRETPSDSNSLGPTGEVGDSTGEVGDSTGEVGDSTGEELPSGDPPAAEIVPSEGTPSTTGESETAGNTSSTGEGTAPVDNDASTSEQPVTAIPSSIGSDVGSSRPEVGAGIADLSSSSSVDTNGNALATDLVTANSAENPNAVVQPISADGSAQTVNFGDISNVKPASASLDKDEYKPGDTAVLTISDQAANRDPTASNTVIVVIDGVAKTATEDGPNSGNFKVDFIVKDGGSKLEYDASHPQATAVINGVSNGGEIQVEEVSVSSFSPELANNRPTQLVGNAIQFSFLGGAELDRSSGVCDSVGLPPPCGGSSTVTISYANGRTDLHNQDPKLLTAYQFFPGLGWVDLKEVLPPDSIKVDTVAKTVTVIDSPYGLTTLVAGFPAGGGGGGGGGAIGLPGAGLVLDLVAPVTTEAPVTSSQPVSESTTSVPETTVLNVNDDDDTTANVSATQEPIKSEVGTSEVSDVVTVSRTGNKTITVPGAGNVTLAFTNVISEGELTVSAAKDSDLAGFKVIKNGDGPAKLTGLDNVPYSLVGNVFVIGPTDSEFKGTLTVNVPYNTALLSPGSDVRLLYYTGSGWEDVTSKSAVFNSVSGSLDNLGAVTPAVKSQAINLVSAVQ